jgi:flagellar hook-associated protein 1 FlgK
MTGLSQLLQTGLTGLSAAAEGMQTVASNTANVNTPGYNAQSINQTELQALDNGPGRGTDVSSVQRAFDQFAYQETVSAASSNEAAQVVQSNLQNLVALFPVASGGAGGLGSALDGFFSAANAVAQDPTSTANRQAFLGQAQTLASDFRSVGNQLSANLSSIDDQTSTAVQQINVLTEQIAHLNQTIAGNANSDGQGPNNLLDQRDQLVQQLAQQLGVSTVTRANGVLDVYTSGGAVLVSSGNSYQLTVGADEYADGEVAVTYGPTGQDLTKSFSLGQLGGLLSSRAQLIIARDSVGALATGLAEAVNNQQSLGLDLQGNSGQPLFSLTGPAVYASKNNAGSGNLTAAVDDPASFKPADFVLTKTASGFDATEIGTGQVTALGNGPTLSLDGLTITVSGTVQTGDSFKLEPTSTAAQTVTVVTNDPSAIAAASAYVATPGNNTGNVQAATGSPVASSALPAGAVLVPATAFGQPISIKFTSGTSFNILSSSNAVIASGTYNPNSGAEIAIAYPASSPAGQAATISLSAGTAAAGDSFALTPGGVGSNSNIVALANLATHNLISGQTPGGFYGALVTSVGSRGQ